MAHGEAIKTSTAYSATASNALMDAAVHELITDSYDKLHQLASVLANDDEVILVADLIRSAWWQDQKCAMDCARKTAKHITEAWALSSNDTALAVLDNDETSGSADVAIQQLRLALHQTQTGWTGTSILPGIGAASKSDCPNIVLVDDFIGTGEKTQKKITWIRENETTTHNIYVATFVGQYRSRHIVGSVSKAYFASHWGWKSITDVYLPNIAQDKINLMLAIEKRFGTIGKTDILGRGRAESTFFPVGTNTPNNVFPIFWKDKHKKNASFRPLLVRSPKG